MTSLLTGSLSSLMHRPLKSSMASPAWLSKAESDLRSDHRPRARAQRRADTGFLARLTSCLFSKSPPNPPGLEARTAILLRVRECVSGSARMLR